MALKYYYYNQLSKKDQVTYKEFLEGLSKSSPSIRLQETNDSAISRVSQIVAYDHPEIFWWLGEGSYTMYGTHSVFQPTYLYGVGEIQRRKRAIESKVSSFMRKIRFGMSEYQKIKTVFEYMIDTVEYVRGADDQNICGSLIAGKCVCAGYARGVQYLLQRMGIECLRVSGYAKGERHAWNIVKCGRKYYHIDATFGDRTFDGGMPQGFPTELRRNYAYLCFDDKMMRADRRAEMPCVLPKCSSDNLNYYAKTGRYYNAYSPAVVKDMQKVIFSGGNVFECQFSNQRAYSSMLRDVQNHAFSDIVGEYYKKMRRTGSYRTWTSESNETLTIVCWY